MINYERRGSGTPLLLLHGIGHRWQAWNPVLDELAAHHEVIAIDLPGFGDSPLLPTGDGHDLRAGMERLSLIIDDLGLGKPHIAGNSLGGLIAIEAAAQGLAASVTALSPAGFWNRRDRSRAIATLRLIALSSRAPQRLGAALVATSPLRNSMMGLLYAHPERIDRQTALGDMAALRGAPAFNPTLRSSRGFRWQAQPASVPLTVAWGTKDRILPARQAKLAAGLLPHARHVLLPDCGHVPMIDNPHLVASTILETCALTTAISE